MGGNLLFRVSVYWYYSNIHLYKDRLATHSTYCIQHLKSTHSTSVCKMWQKWLDFVNQLLCRAWLSIKTPKLALRVSLTPNVRSLLIHYVINVCWISFQFSKTPSRCYIFTHWTDSCVERILDSNRRCYTWQWMSVLC